MLEGKLLSTIGGVEIELQLKRQRRFFRCWRRAALFSRFLRVSSEGAVSKLGDMIKLFWRKGLSRIFQLFCFCVKGKFLSVFEILSEIVGTTGEKLFPLE